MWVVENCETKTVINATQFYVPAYFKRVTSHCKIRQQVIHHVIILVYVVPNFGQFLRFTDQPLHDITRLVEMLKNRNLNQTRAR